MAGAVVGLALIFGSGLLNQGCLEEPFTGSRVVLTLQDLPMSMAGAHYELFANINNGVVPIQKFTVTSSLDVVDFYTGAKLGIINRMASPPKGGVVFFTDVNMAHAESVFLTTEQNGETDPGPSETTVMWGELTDGRPGVRSGQLEGSVYNPFTRRDEPVRGEIAVVLLGE